MAAVLLAGLGAPTHACQICLPFPAESLADRILASEHIVLARENPDKPYTLRAIRTLREGESIPPPLDLFLDSSTRRQLSLDEGLSILCGWLAETREWRRLGLHDAVLAPVVADILAHRTGWRDDPAARVRYFAGYLGHGQAVLSDLAHLEVARAPYRQLVQFADRIPREQLHERLGNLRRMEWHALYILFLGFSGDASDHERIRNEIAECAEFGLVTRTAAWATAFIEIDGAEAIARLRNWYGNRSSRRPEERRAILAALTAHGEQGDPPLRDPVVELMGRLLEADPSLAPEIATVLAQWDRRDLAEPIAILLRDSPQHFDRTATLILRRYVHNAAEPTQPASGSNRLPVLLLVALALLSPLLVVGGRFFRRDLHPAGSR